MAKKAVKTPKVFLSFTKKDNKWIVTTTTKK